MNDAMHLNICSSLDDTMAGYPACDCGLTHAYGEGRKDEREAAIAYFEKVAKETDDQSPVGKAHWCLAAAHALREGWHS
jgi:hypothetical protein